MNSSKPLNIVLKLLFWIWVCILILVNVTPVGGGLKSGSISNRVQLLRLDYIAHMVSFLVFGWLFLLAKECKNNMPFSQAIGWVATLILGLALGVEAIQTIIPYRVFNRIDMVYNFVGALISLLFLPWQSRKTEDLGT